MRRMTLHGVLLSLLLFSFARITPAPAVAQAHPPGRSVANDLIVRLHPHADPAAFAADVGLLAAEDRHAHIPGQATYRFTITDGTTPQQKAAALHSHPLVIYAEPNQVGQIPEARKRSSWAVGFSATDYADQWAPQRMRLPEAHAISRGAGVVVALLDTGVDAAHPALQGRLLPGYDFVAGDADPAEEPPAELPGAYGHGTHVAGLIALAAPDAQVLPLRTLDPAGLGDVWTQALALRYAIAAGAQVINVSFSFTERSRLLEEVIAEATCTASGTPLCRTEGRTGAVVVMAAGNSGINAREWPAATPIPGALAVAASTEQDTLADFSTYGPWVNLAAPGEGIISAVPGGTYAAWSGTSMAAPLVSGTAALVRSADPLLRPTDVVRSLERSAHPIPDSVRRRVDALGALLHHE